MSSLFHHRWSLPILADLDAYGGARFVTLAHRLVVGRESLRRTLDALQRARLVRRNPGHGHSLRPEYVLTERGRALAPAATEVVEVLRDAGLEELGLRKWSLPLLVGLGAGDRHFSALQARYGVSPRALALALKDLAAADLVERRVHDGFPPTTSYRLTQRGAELARAAKRLEEVSTSRERPPQP